MKMAAQIIGKFFVNKLINIYAYSYFLKTNSIYYL